VAPGGDGGERRGRGKDKDREGKRVRERRREGKRREREREGARPPNQMKSKMCQSTLRFSRSLARSLLGPVNPYISTCSTALTAGIQGQSVKLVVYPISSCFSHT